VKECEIKYTLKNEALFIGFWA